MPTYGLPVPGRQLHHDLVDLPFSLCMRYDSPGSRGPILDTLRAVTLDSLLFISFLYLQTFLSSTLLNFLTYFLHRHLYLFSGQMLGHKVGWVFCTQYFAELSAILILDILYPQGTHVDVS